MFGNRGDKLTTNTGDKGGKTSTQITSQISTQHQHDSKVEKRSKSKTGGGLLKSLRSSFRSKKGSKKDRRQRELFNTNNNNNNQEDEQSVIVKQNEVKNEQHLSYSGRVSLDPCPVIAPQDLSEFDATAEDDQDVFTTDSGSQKLAYFQALKSLPEHHDHNLQKNGFVVSETTSVTTHHQQQYQYHTEENDYEEIDIPRNFQSEDIFCIVDRQENIGRDIMGFLRRRSSNTSSKDKQLKRQESDTNSQGSNSSDSIKRKWSLKHKRSKNDITEISDAELIYSTYSNNVEHIEGTLRRKPRSPPPSESDLPDDKSESSKSVHQGKISESEVKAEDMSALNNLLRTLSESEETPNGNIKFTESTSSTNNTTSNTTNTSNDKSLDTPPATPKGILDNIPEWQRDLVHESVPEEKPNRKSDVLEDSRLLDKLLAIQKEEDVNAIDVSTVESTNTSYMLTEDVSISSIVQVQENVEQHSPVFIDEHESIKHMLQTISEQSLDTKDDEGEFEKVILEVRCEDQHVAIEFPDEMLDDACYQEEHGSNKVMRQNKIVYPLVTVKRQLSEGGTVIMTPPLEDSQSVETIEQSPHLVNHSIEILEEECNEIPKVTIKQHPIQKSTFSIKIGAGTSQPTVKPSSKPVKISVKINSNDHTAQHQTTVEPITDMETESNRTSTTYSECGDFDSVGQIRLQSVQFSEEEFKTIESHVLLLSSQPKDIAEESEDELNEGSETPLKDEIHTELPEDESETEEDDQGESNSASQQNVERFAVDTTNNVIQEALHDINKISKTVSLNRKSRIINDNDNDDDEMIVPIHQKDVECEMNFDDLMQDQMTTEEDHDDENAFKQNKSHAEILQKEIDLTNELKMTTQGNFGERIQDDYTSACADINPRIQEEINDRERRIQRLLELEQSGCVDVQIDEQVETVVECQIPVLESENVSRREVLMHTLILKMSQQQIPMTLVKDGETKTVQIAFSPTTVDDIDGNDSDITTTEQSASDTDPETIEQTKDEYSTSKPDETLTDHPKESKVEKLAFAIMSKYRSADLCNSENEPELTLDRPDEDVIAPVLINPVESGVDFSILARDDSMQSNITDSPEHYEVHDGLFSDVEAVEKEPMSDEEEKLIRNHFFNDVQKKEKVTTIETMVTQESVSEVKTLHCNEVEQMKTSPSRQVMQVEDPVTVSGMQVVVTASTPEPTIRGKPTADEEIKNNNLERKNSNTFRKRPSLTPSESDTNDLTHNVRRSIEIDDQIDDSEQLITNQIQSTEESSNQIQPTDELANQIQTTGTFNVTMFESRTEQHVQYTETYSSSSSQTAKKDVTQSNNIPDHSYNVPVNSTDDDYDVDTNNDKAKDTPSTLADEEMILPTEHNSNVESAAPGFGDFDEILAESHDQLVQQLDQSESDHGNVNVGISDDYNSACRDINPRLGLEISDRERRIQELLNRGERDDEELMIVSTTTQDVCSEPVMNTLVVDEHCQFQSTDMVESSSPSNTQHAATATSTSTESSSTATQGRTTLTVIQRDVTELIPGVGDYVIPHNTYQSASSTPGPIINTEQLVVPITPTETKPFQNDQAVTLEIRGDRLIEKGDTQKYQNTDRCHQVPVTLSSIKLRKPQNITLELRSAGPLIGKANALLTHSIEVQHAYSSTTTAANGGGDLNNNKISLYGKSVQPNEELLNLRKKHLPTTSL